MNRNVDNKLKKEQKDYAAIIVFAEDCESEVIYRSLPPDEIGRKALLIESPEVFVCSSTHLHAVTSRGEAGLDHTICIYQVLPGQSIDLERVPHVWIKKLEYWMHSAHLPVCSQYKWFHSSMGP